MKKAFFIRAFPISYRAITFLVVSAICSVGSVSGQEESRSADLSGRWDSIGWFGGFDASPYAPPSLNDAALVLKRDYNDETDNPVYECIAPGVPNISIVPYMIEITQGREEVVIHHEYFDIVRTVHMGQANYPVDVERTIQGYSIGWYEAESLVVDTRNFTFDRIGMDMSGAPTSENKRVIERYTRRDDGRVLHLEFTIEDPDYLTENYTREREYRYAPELELYEFECEPEYAGKTREMYQD
jgi:hypothetical protein